MATEAILVSETELHESYESSRLLGKGINRVDGKLKVTGSARYAAEFDIDELVHGVVIQSTIAKGRIAEIDTSEAEKAPGFIDVITHKNAPKLQPKADFNAAWSLGEDIIVLQDDKVHYAGQHIGLVVADTLEHATHAASLVKVSYEEEKPILRTLEGLADAYKPVRFRMFFDAQVSHGDVAKTLSSATVQKVIDQTYTTQVIHHNPMEPHATIAVWEADHLTVYDSTQWVLQSRDALASLLEIPLENVRVISYFVGGGFGSKGPSWQHILLAAIASRKVGQPVKVVLTRQQLFTSTGHRADTIQRITLGASIDGKLLAVKHDTITPTSFVSDFFEPSSRTSAVLYSCPNIEISHRVVKLNIASPAQMRAPGETPGLFALESAMDELSYELKIDPIKLRIINNADADPVEGHPFSSKYLSECYETGARMFGWRTRNPVPGSVHEGKYLVGMGMATASFPGVRTPASAKVSINADGSVDVYCATQEIGTGAYTLMAQIAADTLGLPVERVRVEIGDSMFPRGVPSGGSQTTASVGSAVKEAADAALKQLISIAVADAASPIFGENVEDIFARRGELISRHNLRPSRVETFTEVLERGHLPLIEAETKSLTGEERKKFAFDSFGAEFAEVKIDPELGELKVTRFLGVFDVGRIVNVKTARSQVIGAITQGIGMALMEQTIYDQTNGLVVTNNLADYLVPVNADIPQIDVHFIDKPDPYISSIGARGVAEIGITGVSAAIANAVYNATGRRIRDLPITLEKLM